MSSADIITIDTPHAPSVRWTFPEDSNVLCFELANPATPELRVRVRITREGPLYSIVLNERNSTSVYTATVGRTVEFNLSAPTGARTRMR